MNTLNLSAQLAGLVGIGLSLLYLHNRNMRNILLCKMMIDIAWGIHYLLLGAFMGVFVNAISLFREITFLCNRNHPPKYQLLIFIVLNYIAVGFTWKGFYSVLPALACTFATYSFWQKSVVRARYIALLNNCLFFAYDFCVGSLSGIVCETLTFASVLLSILKTGRNKCD